jgi:hypothetical protein
MTGVLIPPEPPTRRQQVINPAPRGRSRAKQYEVTHLKTAISSMEPSAVAAVWR